MHEDASVKILHPLFFYVLLLDELLSDCVPRIVASVYLESMQNDGREAFLCSRTQDKQSRCSTDSDAC
jgi:hypothetical protein